MSRPTVTFGAVGDIMFSSACGEAMIDNGLDWPMAKMTPHLARADVLFGNMESVLLPEDYPDDAIDPRGLVTKFDGAEALARAGFDFMCLANNHVLDGGHVSMVHTRDRIEALGIATGGVGENQAEARRLRVVESGGITFGFLCYCEDTNYSLSTTGPCHAYYTREAVLADVAAKRDAVDVLVVSIHADLEFMETPSVPRRAIFREIAEAGATIVLGHHPHVPQGVERIGKSLVAYSLGNFYFASHTSNYMAAHAPQTGYSFLLLIDVGPDGVEGFERVPAVIAAPPEQRPAPLEGEAAEEMLAYFARLDALVADDEAVARNWRERSLGMLDTYLGRIKDSDRDAVLTDTLGRLLLVAENRNWVDEVFAAVRERWSAQAAHVDPLHRPNYTMQARLKREDP